MLNFYLVFKFKFHIQIHQKLLLAVRSTNGYKYVWVQTNTITKKCDMTYFSTFPALDCVTKKGDPQDRDEHKPSILQPQ